MFRDCHVCNRVQAVDNVTSFLLSNSQGLENEVRLAWYLQKDFSIVDRLCLLCVIIAFRLVTFDSMVAAMDLIAFSCVGLL